MSDRGEPPYWLRGAEHCASCEHPYVLEVGFHCTGCDRGLCAECVVVVRLTGERYCPECAADGEPD